MTQLKVSVAGRQDADALAAFASTHALAWADFASIALLQPDEPKVWVVRDGERIIAASIDDGLAMTVAGADAGLDAIAAEVGSLDRKLVIAGRIDEVRHFVRSTPAPRRERPEHFMAVERGALAFAPEDIPLRIATADDLPLLVRTRTSALQEEYGIPVTPDSRLYRELAAAVERAVSLHGVAIWVEDGACAFTAQLIAKTPHAAMFGDLYTDPELRGNGRATRALTFFCGWLMSESAHVTLRVGVDNAPAVRLYERVGFTVVDAFCSSLGPEAP